MLPSAACGPQVSRGGRRVAGGRHARPQARRCAPRLGPLPAALTGLAVAAAADAGALQQSAGGTSAPASQMAGRSAFQPGVTIDWRGPAVRVAGRVVLRRGPLEFLACFRGKEHESIILLEASAVHVYQALGLIGVSPGQAPARQHAGGVFSPPAGGLVDVSVRWERDGRTRRAPAAAWLREVEYARPPLPRPWIFAGSRLLANGTLAADLTGAGVALVDFSDALLVLSRSHSDRDAELWALANSHAIPPERTAVELVLAPARPRRYRLRLDFRGAAFVNGRYTRAADLADLLWLNHRLEPQARYTIATEGTLPGDVARLRRVLRKFGLPPQVVRFAPPDRPRAGPPQPGRRRGGPTAADGR